MKEEGGKKKNKSSQLNKSWNYDRQGKVKKGRLKREETCLMTTHCFKKKKKKKKNFRQSGYCQGQPTNYWFSIFLSPSQTTRWMDRTALQHIQTLGTPYLVQDWCCIFFPHQEGRESQPGYGERAVHKEEFSYSYIKLRIQARYIPYRNRKLWMLENVIIKLCW